MTKLTNYLATVTDVNSVFPPKGGVIANSERGVIKDQTGQTAGSVGAANNWYIDESASPFVTYTNPRLPRWQDLVALNCNFTFSTVQVPYVTPPVLDSTTGITIFFDSSGSMEQVLPSLEYMQNTLLKPCLLPYYNNDSVLYNQRVKIVSRSDERTIYWLGEDPPIGATKTVNLTFSNESFFVYTNPLPYGDPSTNVDTLTTPYTFLVNRPTTVDYTTDINFAQTRLSNNIRGINYRVIYSGGPSVPYDQNIDTVTKQFYQAVYTGQGNYSGVSGLSTNGYAYLIDYVAALGLPGTSTAPAAQYYTNKVIEGMNLLGYNLSPC